MRRDHNHAWECFLWLLYAVLAALFLRLIRRIVLYYGKNQESVERLQTLSKNLVPKELAEDWILRYTPVQTNFLAKVVCFRCDNVLELHAHLLDDTWRLEGEDFVDTVLQWLLGTGVHPILTGLEALVFLGGGHEIPSDVVAFTIQHVFLQDRSMDSIHTSAFRSWARRIQEQLEMLGLLHRLEGKDAYRLSRLVRYRKVRFLEWQKGFLVDLQSSHPAYSSRHLIRLLTENRLFQRAIEALDDEGFCSSRVKYLKDQAAQQHVEDCLLLQNSLRDAMLPPCNLEKSCYQLADQLQDGVAYLVLGQFLDHQRLPLANFLLRSAIRATQQTLQTDLCLMAKSFKRVSTIYLCYELEEEYQQYSEACLALICSKEGGLGFLLEAVTTHTSLEACREISSSGLDHQLDRIELRLSEMAREHLLTLRSANQLLGNLEQASLVEQILKLVHASRRRCRTNSDDQIRWWNTTRPQGTRISQSCRNGRYYGENVALDKKRN